jgi:hypothetical protein
MRRESATRQRLAPQLRPQIHGAEKATTPLDREAQGVAPVTHDDSHKPARNCRARPVPFDFANGHVASAVDRVIPIDHLLQQRRHALSREDCRRATGAQLHEREIRDAAVHIVEYNRVDHAEGA